MRRLVVGCGYLGGLVARLWRDSGDEVYATTRGMQVDALRQAGFCPLTLDVTRGVAVGALPAVDTALFAVGRSGSTMSQIHGDGLRRVLDAWFGSAGRVIYASSTGVYGQDQGEWVDEASVTEPAREGGRACLFGERLLLAHERGRDAIVLRLAGLYGNGRVPRERDVAAGKSIDGSPDAYLNLIHVEDAARAVLMAARGDPGRRIYNVSDGHPPTRGEYAALVASRRGLKPPRFDGGRGRGKRVRNDRIVHDLRLRLQYPSFREGLAMRPGLGTADEATSGASGFVVERRKPM